MEDEECHIITGTVEAVRVMRIQYEEPIRCLFIQIRLMIEIVYKNWRNRFFDT